MSRQEISMPFDEASYLRAVQSGDFRKLLEPQRRLLDTLLADAALRAGDPVPALGSITETASRMLRVARVGVWRLGADAESALKTLQCLDLYIHRDRRHVRGSVIRSSDAPRYFAAIANETMLAAEDAYEDPRTNEFAGGYLPANGIGALLDAPLIVSGRVAGVLCHEHVGPARRWLAWERTLATSLADSAALVLHEAEYRAARISLRANS